MPFVEHEAYRRWIAKWRSHLVYGANASGPSPASADSTPPRRPVPIAQLPGADIVRAY